MAGVEVGLINDTIIVFPTRAQLQQSPLHLTIAGTREGILMIEGAATEFLSEERMLEALAVGHAAIGRWVGYISMKG